MPAQENMVMKVLKNPWKIVKHIGGKGYLKWIPDKLYLQMCYRAAIGNKLNLKNPQGFNEKLQWLKLYDHNPLYTTMVDKAAVKDYVANIIGKEHIIPTLGVWDKFEAIDFDSLPNQFVLKCTHDSGGSIICDDKATFDYAFAKKKLSKSMNRQFFYVGREWPYKDVLPRIIAEEYIVDESRYELKDYKFFCFDGEPKALFVATDRSSDTKFDFFDIEFDHLPFTNGHPNAKKKINKPDNFEEMVQLARKLSQGMPHVRIDLYNASGKILFGEITFYHWSGFVPFEPEEWDYKFGSWINLPQIREKS